MSLKEALKGIKIPSWIKKGHKYKNRRNEIYKDEEFPLYEGNIETLEDLKEVISVIYFWDIPAPYPYFIWEFLLNLNNTDLGRKVKKFLKNEGEVGEFINCPSYELCDLCAYNGEIECLKFCASSEIEDKYFWDEDTCKAAAQNGQLDCLIFLHENDCPWNEDTCKQAAIIGSLECLEYSHINGCPWNEEVCFAAALNDEYECLSYAYDNGSPWNENNSNAAGKVASYRCLTYAFERGCNCGIRTFELTARNYFMDEEKIEERLKCLEFLYKNNCYPSYFSKFIKTKSNTDSLLNINHFFTNKILSHFL